MLNRVPLTAPLAHVFSALETSDRGLTGQEARRRLAEAGPNEPRGARPANLAWQTLRFFANPLVLILLIASLVSSVVEQLREAVAPTATVLRDGAWVEIPRREVVPGDIVRLAAGDLVPADARLVEAKDLHVQQAALTGESMPAEKEAVELDSAPSNPAEARHTVFLGTSVASGNAIAVVVATGRATAFGDIAARLASRPPETEFERGIRQFSLLIMRTVIFLVLFVFLVLAALRHNPLESLLFTVALAVGLTPEFLPMITTVTLGWGAVRMARQKVVVKHLAAMQNFGSIDILCSDKTGTLTSGNMILSQLLGPGGRPSERAFSLAYLNSYYETGIKNPLDRAILDAVTKTHPPDVSTYRKVDEIPFDFERRRLSVVVERDGTRTLITKGAPESVVAACSAYEEDGRPCPLDAQARVRCANTYQQASAQGYRVLAVAYRSVSPRDVYRTADEVDLVLAGFLTFSDPALEDAAEVLRDLRRDGVRVMILTGDNELVACHVCSQVGLDGARVVLGDAVDRMSDGALAHAAEQTTVFARVSPAQKNRIMLALKAHGHVVGFLGDGINDAPSLHAADVGISVSTGVDVAKDAADVILLERSLRVLHTGIIEGRKAFGNVMKYLLMGTSSNFGNMFSMAGASAFLPFLPMLPTQILVNNFLYDLSQVTIPTDTVDPTFILKPRRWNIALIRNFMVLIGPISSLYDFLTFGALLTIFHSGEVLFHTGWFVESLATHTLVIFVIRTAGNPLRSRPSLPLAVSGLTVVAAGLVLPYTPLAALLGFTPMPALYFGFLAGITATYLLLVEFGKRRLMGEFLG